MEWHTARTGNHQGLVIDEAGRNVAVSYDEADAPLLAAAPELLAELKSVLWYYEAFRDGSPKGPTELEDIASARAAIRKARGDA